MCINILTSCEYMHMAKWLSAANISHISLLTCSAYLSCLASWTQVWVCVPKQNVRIRQGLVTLNTRREFPPKSLSRAMGEMPVLVPNVAWMRRNMTRYTCSCLGCAARSMINHSFERSDSTVPSRGWLAPTDMSLHRVGNQRNCLRVRISWE